MFILLIIIYLIFIFTQLILGIRSWELRETLKRKYSYPLGSQIELVEVLEKAFKKKTNITLKATSAIYEIAYAEKNILFINKNVLYSKDLFTSFYTLFILNFVDSKFVFLKDGYKYQNILFYIGILLIIISFFHIYPNYNIDIYLVIAAILLQVVLIIFTLYILFKYELILNTTLKDSIKILKLDDVEAARAESLAEELKYITFEYPLEVVWRLLQAFK